MNTPKDNHSVTGSPLMCVEFMIIHTLIWAFLLVVPIYEVLNLLTGVLWYLPLGPLRNLLPLLFLLALFLEWPTVIYTALVITIIRCIFRRTTVTLSGDTVIISRLRHTDRLPLADFIRPKTVESFVSVHFAAWVFRKRYLIFGNHDGKEAKYRLYEYSEKDLEQVLQLLTRVSRAEHLEEDTRTKMMMNAFQNETEILLNPQRLWGRLAGRMAVLSVFSLVIFLVSICLFYEMLMIPPQYDSASVLVQIVGYGSALLSLISLFLLCRASWTLAVNAILKGTCPQKIAFVGNMLQIDRTMYSTNRIQQVIMNPSGRKLPMFGHFQITIITSDGTHKYWLGNAAGLGYTSWQTLCRNMQELLISCPAKLIYR